MQPSSNSLRKLTMRTKARFVGSMIAVFAFAVFGERSARADARVGSPSVVTDSADVVAAVMKYHAALASGDSAAALTLLTDDVTVLESGSVESRADYRAHHLPADIEFARTV